MKRLPSNLNADELRTYRRSKVSHEEVRPAMEWFAGWMDEHKLELTFRSHPFLDEITRQPDTLHTEPGQLGRDPPEFLSQLSLAVLAEPKHHRHELAPVRVNRCIDLRWS